MRVKQWRMPEPMNLWEEQGQGAVNRTPPQPPSTCSRCEAEDDAVLPDDPGAKDLADGMVPGLRGPLRQGLQLCHDRGTRVRAGTVPLPLAPLVWGGVWQLHGPHHTPARKLSWWQEPLLEPGPLLSASACKVFLALSSCRVASSQRGDSSSSAGHLGYKHWGHGALQGPGPAPALISPSRLQSDAAQKPSTSNLSKHLLEAGGSLCSTWRALASL